MASLQHVCIWSDSGWKHITAEEAAAIHPSGTVSAESGLFICELCGQNVLFTQGKYQVPHFRHSSREKNKNCPERIFGVSYSFTYQAGEHDLPIRIVNITPYSFQFELGLIQVPVDLLPDNFSIAIKPTGNNTLPFIYSKERLNYYGVTYLNIGDVPYTKYTLVYHEINNELSSYWPRKVTGIDLKGTLFEKRSGKKLPYDSDVEVNKEYYLLTNKKIYETKAGVTIKECSLKQSSWDTIYLYLVSANELNENAAKFFLNYHYRLTSEPVSMQPIWPLYIQGSYVIKYNQKSVYMLLKGNAPELKAFPKANICRLFKSDHEKLYEIFCSGRQQLISTGRTNVLEYAYFWKEPIVKEKGRPRFSIRDKDGSSVEEGEYTSLPTNGYLRISAEYDGEVIISRDAFVIDKRKIFAGSDLYLNDISYGMHIRLLIGVDCMWECRFIKEKNNNFILNEYDILKYIQGSSSSISAIPHSLRNMAAGLKKYPKIRQWILKCIQAGKMPKNSFRKLQKMYCKIKDN